MIKQRAEVHSNKINIFAPAKINLFLAVTGKREDGFHEICTVMCKVDVGDELVLERKANEPGVRVVCPGYEELENKENLAFIAAERWLVRSKEKWGVDISLVKKIPPMSGLGGGSSDAISVLLAMNKLADKPLPLEVLLKLASEIGSDCAGILAKGPCIADGKGESVRLVRKFTASELHGKKLFLFRPMMGLSTKEIYTKFSKNHSFSEKAWVQKRVSEWNEGTLSTEDLLYNDLEKPVFEKHRYFLPLFDEMTRLFGLSPRMSGSGSCCFTFLPSGFSKMNELKQLVQKSWGCETWMAETECLLDS